MNRAAHGRLAITIRCAILFLLMLGVSQKPWAGVDVPPRVADVLEGYTSAGIEIVDTFDAPGEWIGVVATAREKGLILYLDRSGENLFMGMMLGARGGANHTENLLKRYFPDQYESQGNAATMDLGAADTPPFTAEELAAIPGILYHDFEGEPLAHLYMFVDFACGHCRSLSERLRSDALLKVLADQRIELMIFPLAFSGEKTAFKSAYAIANQPSSEKFLSLFGNEASLPTDMAKEQVGTGAINLAQVMNAAATHGITSVPVLFLVRGDSVRVGTGSPDLPELLEYLAPPVSK